MKKLLLLLPIALLLLAACSKSNVKPSLSPTTATAATIAGTWKITGDTTSQVQQSSNRIKTNSIAVPITEFVYNADGSGHMVNADGDVLNDFTFTVASALIKMTIMNTGGITSEEDLTILSITSGTMALRETQGNSYADIGLVKQ